jgi:glutamate-1-semialdehyde 2,1-aminomutase
MNYKRSSALFQEALKTIPGGVNSPVRAFKSVGGDPIFMESAKGAYLRDVDGNSYVDYINSWGPQILGHVYGPVIASIKEAADHGTSFGTPTEIEGKMAGLLTRMVPGVDQVRMVNSGTEACMSAIRLARGYTGREKIIKFAGCYHGHADAFLIEAGSGAVTFGSPNSPGVTRGTAKDTLLAVFNDVESVEEILATQGEDVAAVIIEPVAGNMGCIPPAEGFLESLREMCTRNGTLLIFDEVMTGFRLAPGGAQEYYGVAADIVCFGKIIGGGLPVGAFAASSTIMGHLAPEGPVYQAGTLSGNPLAMAAGYTMLETLHENPEIYLSLESNSATLEDGLRGIFSSKGMAVQINRVASMISVHFSDTPVTDFESAKAGDNATFKAFFHHMLGEGIYLPPSAYETWFVCNDITSLEIEKTLEGVKTFSGGSFKV